MKIHSNIRDYDVRFVDAADFLRDVQAIPERVYAIDANVWQCHGDGCLSELAKESPITVPISEDRKRLESVVELYDQLIERAAKKNLTLISIGGGILQDITGFAASTLYRGINWVFMPTTLLAQADSCIGSKTSLNYRRFKNLIGTFYPPSEVLIHIPFLNTLEDVDFFSGLGEVVKLHIMGGADMARDLVALRPAILARDASALRAAIERALCVKQSYIADDEFDSGRRNMLNFGHCFGHAIESASEFRVPHGQAVVVGMLLANAVAVRRGILSEGTRAFLTGELLLPSLTVQIRDEYLDSTHIVDAMKKDKKRRGDHLALIMLDDQYNMRRVDDLTPAEAVLALQEVAETLHARPMQAENR